MPWRSPGARWWSGADNGDALEVDPLGVARRPGLVEDAEGRPRGLGDVGVPGRDRGRGDGGDGAPGDPVVIAAPDRQVLAGRRILRSGVQQRVAGDPGGQARVLEDGPLNLAGDDLGLRLERLGVRLAGVRTVGVVAAAGI